MAETASRVMRFHDDYRWDGVEREAYKGGQDGERDWRDIVRQVLVGKRREPTAFHVRYFEVAPGGYSSLEKHGHAHLVIAVRGTGRVILGETAQDLQPLDAVYVAPWTIHQFLAGPAEPFGFFCVVDADRDRPQAP